jgi:hypothetical protein
MKSSWPKITARRNAAGQITSYSVDCGYRKVPGEKRKRIRFSFKKRIHAETKAAQVRAAADSEGKDYHDDLTKVERTLAHEATMLGRSHEVTVLDAMKFRIAHLELARRSKPVRDVIPEVLRNKESLGRKSRTIDATRRNLLRFAKKFGDRPISDILPHELDEYLSSLGGKLSTRTTRHNELSSLFSFAKMKIICATIHWINWCDRKFRLNAPIFLLFSKRMPFSL